MMAFGQRWLLFAIWYMWWGLTPYLTSAQVDDTKFSLEKGIRYENGVMGRRSARSKLQCAGECAMEKYCYAFNFGSGQCELLPLTASRRTEASGWTYGLPRHPGKYKEMHQDKNHSETWLSN